MTTDTDVDTTDTHEVVTPGATAAEYTALVERSLRFLRDLNGKDPEQIATWFCDESTLWIPPAAARVGARRIARLLRVIFAQYAELHWRARRLYPVNATTMITEVDTWGRFADGRDYRNSILTVQRFNAAGKLLVLSDYFKSTEVFASAPVPEPAARPEVSPVRTTS
ncbi:MAG TPA: nuclear transport factor 2 family protein [Kofleriaceae bacterium]|nr:nuclear transport factor 2 family protein [Kofleriaceae bacterium]